MNQILNTNLKKYKKVKNRKFFKLQFFISYIIFSILIISFIFYFISIKKKEKISIKVIDSYNISRLYSDNSDYNMHDNNNNIFGIIEIPKINIYYPILSNINDDLLKIAPCKFYGNNLDKNDNICIAGHNYNNSLFFSNIVLLSTNDEIYIYNNEGRKYIYYVSEMYEVKYNDLSPVFDYNKNSRELTLITCNNLNSNRIIVKAKQKSSW